MLHIVSPHLSAGARLRVKQAYAYTMCGSRLRRGYSRGTGADDENVVVITHR
jgi:hypothetical protein